MVLSLYDWIYGISGLASFFLAIVAVFLAIDLIRRTKKQLKPWKFFLCALILFSLWEMLGALSTFGVIEHSLLITILPSFFLALLLVSLVLQIQIAKGWAK